MVQYRVKLYVDSNKIWYRVWTTTVYLLVLLQLHKLRTPYTGVGRNLMSTTVLFWTSPSPSPPPPNQTVPYCPSPWLYCECPRGCVVDLNDVLQLWVPINVHMLAGWCRCTSVVYTVLWGSLHAYSPIINPHVFNGFLSGEWTGLVLGDN